MMPFPPLIPSLPPSHLRSVDPERDMEIINLELALSDLSQVEMVRSASSLLSSLLLSSLPFA